MWLLKFNAFLFKEQLFICMCHSRDSNKKVVDERENQNCFQLLSSFVCVFSLKFYERYFLIAYPSLYSQTNCYMYLKFYFRFIDLFKTMVSITSHTIRFFSLPCLWRKLIMRNEWRKTTDDLLKSVYGLHVT